MNTNPPFDRRPEGTLSGVALRSVGVPRPFQRAVDEARWRTVEEGFGDERPEVMTHSGAEYSRRRVSIGRHQ